MLIYSKCSIYQKEKKSIRLYNVGIPLFEFSLIATYISLLPWPVEQTHIQILEKEATWSVSRIQGMFIVISTHIENMGWNETGLLWSRYKPKIKIDKITRNYKTTRNSSPTVKKNLQLKLKLELERELLT